MTKGFRAFHPCCMTRRKKKATLLTPEFIFGQSLKYKVSPNSRFHWQQYWQQPWFFQAQKRIIGKKIKHIYTFCSTKYRIPLELHLYTGCTWGTSWQSDRADAVIWRVQVRRKKKSSHINRLKWQNIQFKYWTVKKWDKFQCSFLTVNHIFPTAPIKFIISRNVCSSFISRTKVEKRDGR